MRWGAGGEQRRQLSSSATGRAFRLAQTQAQTGGTVNQQSVTCLLWWLRLGGQAEGPSWTLEHGPFSLPCHLASKLRHIRSWPVPAATGTRLKTSLGRASATHRLPDINTPGLLGTCQDLSSWQEPRSKGSPSLAIPQRKQGCLSIPWQRRNLVGYVWWRNAKVRMPRACWLR